MLARTTAQVKDLLTTVNDKKAKLGLGLLSQDHHHGQEQALRTWSIFTARRSYASAVLGVVILSVRLSHACFVTNPKNLPAIFFIPHERAILLVFCHPTVVGGRRPLPPLIGDRSDPPPSKIAHVDRFPPVTSQH